MGAVLGGEGREDEDVEEEDEPEEEEEEVTPSAAATLKEDLFHSPIFRMSVSSRPAVFNPVSSHISYMCYPTYLAQQN